jgi:nitrate reductase NapE component
MKDEYKPKEESNSRLVTSFRSFSQFTGIFVALVGGAVFIGWMFDVSILKSIHPHLVAVKASSALCFVLIGVSLRQFRAGKPQSIVQKRKRNIVRVCACLYDFER